MNAKLKKDLLGVIDFTLGMCQDYPMVPAAAGARARALQMRAEVEALPVEVERTPAFEHERVLYCPDCGSDNLTLWDNEYVGWRLSRHPVPDSDGVLARFKGGTGEYQGLNEVHCNNCETEHSLPVGVEVDFC